MRDHDTEMLLQSGLLCAALSNSSMERHVHFFTLSIHLFYKWPHRRPSSSVPWKTALQRDVPGDVSKPSQLYLSTIIRGHGSAVIKLT